MYLTYIFIYICEDWIPPLLEDDEQMHRTAALGDEFELIRKMSVFEYGEKLLVLLFVLLLFIFSLTSTILLYF